jgi:F-type H+-transporting ATPase subunit delta
MTQRTSAARYAKALLDVAIAEADPQQVDDQLAAVADLFTSHADLWRTVTNPAVPSPKKRAIVDELLPHLSVATVLGKTLQLLASRDRLGLLPDLAESYRSRLMDYRKVVRADVTSSVPLPADRAQQIQKKLEALTGRTVVMTAATNPDLIGGVVARIGSTVYDGSVKRQLEKFREQLTGRQA